MNTEESTVREDLARLLPPPGDPALPPGRLGAIEEFLMGEFTARAAGAPEPGEAAGTAGAAGGGPAPGGRGIPRRLPRRLGWVAVPVAAALAGGALVVLPQTGGGSSGGESAATGDVTVGEAVDRIVYAALHEEVAAPGPGQYVYVHTRVETETFPLASVEEPDVYHRNEEGPYERELWLSPDGTDGWVEDPHFLGGHRTVYAPEGVEQELYGPGMFTDGQFWPDDAEYEPAKALTPTYEFLASLPTDPQELLDLVYAAPGVADREDGEGRDYAALLTIGSLIEEALLPPELAAAIYQAAAEIPGVELETGVADAAGRAGIALAWDDGEFRTEWIFDGDTYTYLGQRITQLTAGRGVEAGTVLRDSAVLDRAVVDRPQERPGEGAA
ncbi:CU044_5270 family protein [Streptomyces hoynatensis]|uniref:CU044_5270 family protein n=1 Tax=Streptomyces hoynatensis TaxID=1141874 RepID=A0A3A9Z0W0_9ACTN|nr:CU044_5270 family protein [Streptomyces hoynatensis]RKN41770.1 hypothetical protein D7294_15015 [Streptomyces hoynatensis]